MNLPQVLPGTFLDVENWTRESLAQTYELFTDCCRVHYIFYFLSQVGEEMSPSPLHPPCDFSWSSPAAKMLSASFMIQAKACWRWEQKCKTSDYTSVRPIKFNTNPFKSFLLNLHFFKRLAVIWSSEWVAVVTEEHKSGHGVVNIIYFVFYVCNLALKKIVLISWTEDLLCFYV